MSEDYRKACQIVSTKDYSKANKRFLMNMVLDVYPCNLVLEDIGVTISLDLKNRLVIDRMRALDDVFSE